MYIYIYIYIYWSLLDKFKNITYSFLRNKEMVVSLFDCIETWTTKKYIKNLRKHYIKMKNERAMNVIP